MLDRARDDEFRTSFVREPSALRQYPALVLNARNDPFIPESSLPTALQVSQSVTLWQPEEGGHVGFATGRWPGNIAAVPAQIAEWLSR